MNVRDLREAVNALGSELDLLPVLVIAEVAGLPDGFILTVEEVKVNGGQHVTLVAS